MVTVIVSSAFFWFVIFVVEMLLALTSTLVSIRAVINTAAAILIDFLVCKYILSPLLIYSGLLNNFSIKHWK